VDYIHWGKEGVLEISSAFYELSNFFLMCSIKELIVCLLVFVCALLGLVCFSHLLGRGTYHLSHPSSLFLPFGTESPIKYLPFCWKYKPLKWFLLLSAKEEFSLRTEMQNN
jgi:hypothetical protein